ncbi:MAG: hypothetical protein ACPGNV_17600 [Mangrovicoccus sp.]
MFRLMIWTAIFASGAYLGSEYMSMRAIKACAKAGGSFDTQAFYCQKAK